MRSSKSDLFIYKTWFKLLIFYFIMFVLSATVPIAASFPGLGFPCYFNALVNYSAINLTERNVAKHLTPTLFLEEPEMFTYITVSFIVDCCSAIYYFLGALAIVLAKKKFVISLTTLSQWIAMVGTPTLILIGMWRLWTIQLFIQTLSYKHIYLAAFVYLIHFMFSFLHTQFYISRNSRLWAIKTLEQGIPPKTLLETVVFTLKPVVANLELFCLAIEMLVFSLSFLMAIGNSFYVLVSDIVFGAINLYLVLVLFWVLFTELYLVKYMKIHMGFYLGVLVGCVILMLPTWRYEHIFVAAKLHSAVLVNIGMIVLLCFLAAVVRLLRLTWCASVPRATYAPIAMTRPTAKLKSRVRRVRLQSPSGPALMEGESDDDGNSTRGESESEEEL
nr:envelope glycoprotein M [Equid gammaherpesvirus 5]UTK45564.1 envelope glycoprotein M [Equid gammaherpesvirus 5]UTK45643.1 envelope glycoprotein M [Equid gammaherpesvirus 5]UTK45722.1 envelope glycoprotein M [Equid gammaherpesvirus 5]